MAHGHPLRRYMRWWREFVPEARKERQAAEHADRVLVRRALSQWRRVVERQRALRVPLRRAMLVRALRQWRDVVEGMQLGDVVAGAVARRRRRALAEALHTWRESAAAAARAQEQQRVAVQHWRSAMAHKMFTLWRRRAALMREARARWMQACSHHDRIFRRALFLRWRANARRHRTQRDLLALAESQHAIATRRRVFAAWRRQLALRREGASMTAMAGREHLRFVVRRLQRYALARRRIWNDSNRAKRKHYFTLLRRSFGQWRALLAERTAHDDELEARARPFVLARLVEPAWRVWRGRFKAQMRLRQLFSCTQESGDARLARRVLDAWRAAARHRTESIRSLRKQVTLHRTRAVFSQWRARTDERLRARGLLARDVLLFWHMRAKERAQRRALADAAREWSQQRRVAQSWRLWRDAYAGRVAERDNLRAALFQWANVRLRRAWKAWMAHVDAARERAAEERAVLEARNRALRREAVALWAEGALQKSDTKFQASAQQQAQAARKVFDLVKRIAVHWRAKTAARLLGRQGPPPMHVRRVRTVPPRPGAVRRVTEHDSVETQTLRAELDRIVDSPKRRPQPRVPEGLLESSSPDETDTSESVDDDVLAELQWLEERLWQLRHLRHKYGEWRATLAHHAHSMSARQRVALQRRCQLFERRQPEYRAEARRVAERVAFLTQHASYQ